MRPGPQVALHDTAPCAPLLPACVCLGCFAQLASPAGEPGLLTAAGLAASALRCNARQPISPRPDCRCSPSACRGICTRAQQQIVSGHESTEARARERDLSFSGACASGRLTTVGAVKATATSSDGARWWVGWGYASRSHRRSPLGRARHSRGLSARRAGAAGHGGPTMRRRRRGRQGFGGYARVRSRPSRQGRARSATHHQVAVQGGWRWGAGAAHPHMARR